MMMASELSLSERHAYEAVSKRVKLAQRSRVVVLFGPARSGKTRVAQALIEQGGEYCDFSTHLSKLLSMPGGPGPHPERLEATLVTNYLLELTKNSSASFLVVDGLGTVLNLLAQNPSRQGSQQKLFLKRLAQVPFYRPLVVIFPLWTSPRWLNAQGITDALGTDRKWVYLKPREIDQAYLAEKQELRQVSTEETQYR